MTQTSDGLYVRKLPAELLKDINIVDTPGTNVIVDRQQRLTEEYVPRADIVLFCISAGMSLSCQNTAHNSKSTFTVLAAALSKFPSSSMGDKSSINQCERLACIRPALLLSKLPSRVLHCESSK